MYRHNLYFVMTDRYYKTRARLWLYGLLCCLGLIASLCGCRSSRHTVEKTQGALHASVSNVDSSYTLRVAAAAGEAEFLCDSVSSSEFAVVSIDRDTAGRIVKIVRSLKAHIGANAFRQWSGSGAVMASGTSHRAAGAATLDSISATEKETAKEFKVKTPLEVVLVLIAAAVMVLFYLYDWICRLWEKHCRK